MDRIEMMHVMAQQLDPYRAMESMASPETIKSYGNHGPLSKMMPWPEYCDAVSYIKKTYGQRLLKVAQALSREYKKYRDTLPEKLRSHIFLYQSPTFSEYPGSCVALITNDCGGVRLTKEEFEELKQKCKFDQFAAKYSTKARAIHPKAYIGVSYSSFKDEDGDNEIYRLNVRFDGRWVIDELKVDLNAYKVDSAKIAAFTKQCAAKYKAYAAKNFTRAMRGLLSYNVDEELVEGALGLIVEFDSYTYMEAGPFESDAEIDKKFPSPSKEATSDEIDAWRERVSDYVSDIFEAKELVKQFDADAKKINPRLHVHWVGDEQYVLCISMARKG